VPCASLSYRERRKVWLINLSSLPPRDLSGIRQVIKKITHKDPYKYLSDVGGYLPSVHFRSAATVRNQNVTNRWVALAVMHDGKSAPILKSFRWAEGWFSRMYNYFLSWLIEFPYHYLQLDGLNETTNVIFKVNLTALNWHLLYWSPSKNRIKVLYEYRIQTLSRRKSSSENSIFSLKFIRLSRILYSCKAYCC